MRQTFVGVVRIRFFSPSVEGAALSGSPSGAAAEQASAKAVWFVGRVAAIAAIAGLVTVTLDSACRSLLYLQVAPLLSRVPWYAVVVAIPLLAVALAEYVAGPVGFTLWGTSAGCLVAGVSSVLAWLGFTGGLAGVAYAVPFLGLGIGSVIVIAGVSWMLAVVRAGTRRAGVGLLVVMLSLVLLCLSMAYLLDFNARFDKALEGGLSSVGRFGEPIDPNDLSPEGVGLSVEIPGMLGAPFGLGAAAGVMAYASFSTRRRTHVGVLASSGEQPDEQAHRPDAPEVGVDSTG